MEVTLARNTTSSIWIPDRKYFYYTRFNTSSEYVKTLIYSLTFVAIPAISLLGIAGNALTVCVLRHQGFRKSHNIFMLALAISDTLYLVGVNNVAKIIYGRTGRIGFDFPQSVSMTLYVLHAILAGMEVDGKYMSMILPTFISFERFIAVYFPLHLKSLVTCKRAKVAVAILFTSWIPTNIYFTLLFRFEYMLDPVTNTSVGYIMRSDLMLNRPDVYKVISGFFFMVSGPVPVIFVIIMCVAVGVQIQIARKQTLVKSAQWNTSSPRQNTKPTGCRKHVLKDTSDTNLGNLTADSSLTMQNVRVILKMKCREADLRPDRYISDVQVSNGFVRRAENETVARKKKLVSQTTMMLLSTCVFYSVIVTSSNLPSIILNRDTWESDTGAVVELCTQLAVSINSSVNFAIYFTVNRHFRTTLKNLLYFKKHKYKNDLNQKALC